MAGKSPRSVAIESGIAVGLVTMLATGAALWGNGIEGQWWLPLLSGAAVGTVCFVLVYRQLGLYIQERVRIIYKTIRRLKGSTSHINLDMRDDIVEQVNRDVMSWAESQIEEITTLRETDTFRQEFIGNLAHELKTPIFNIQGFILTLLEGGMEDPEINRKFLLKAAKNVERMSGLLEDLDVIT
ncbi:MAG: histidine kinase dimerization/phospho-acceptor domain-containing protein, partial [Flavobacteriales bacterium]|nr:histidine kinase dimerization/phospho-acceptor domain-containing protein [Flavobacteriales bacterium]